MLSLFFSIPLEEVSMVEISLDEFTQLMVEKMAERDDPEKLRTAFKLFDDDGKGYVSYKDIKRVSREINIPLSEDELLRIMAHMDKDCGGEGEVTIDKWQRMFLSKAE